MTTYGILVVNPDWKDQTSTALDKATMLHHRDEITKGTHVLIYVKEPVNALVAQAIISGDAIEVDSSPPEATPTPPIAAAVNTERGLNVTSTPDNPPKPTQMKQEFGVNYRVPLDVTRPTMLTKAIPVSRIKAILGDGFVVFDEEWIALDEADYRALVHEWEAGK